MRIFMLAILALWCIAAAACNPGPARAPAFDATWTPEATRTPRPTSTPTPSPSRSPVRTPAPGATATGATATRSAATVSIPQAEDTVYILVADNYFSPVEATARVGQVVVWSFEGGQEHELDFGSLGAPPDLRFLSGTYSRRPHEPMTIEYSCTIHPEMRGRVVVVE